MTGVDSESHPTTLPPEDLVIGDHIWLAYWLARRQFSRGRGAIPLDELEGEALYALVYASRRFDRTREVPFGAYATLVIRHRLIQAVNVWRRGGRLAHARFTDIVDPSGPEFGARFDVICHRTRGGDDAAAVREVLQGIRQFIRPRWFRALQLHYAHGHTLEEVGELLGVSRQRVRQMLSAAVDQVRRHFPELVDRRHRPAEPCCGEHTHHTSP